MCEAIQSNKGRVPDCDACTPPLMPENEDAVMIFRICQDQLLCAGMGTPYGINQVAVHEAMRLYGVEDKKNCFEKVLLLARTVLLATEGEQ